MARERVESNKPKVNLESLALKTGFVSGLLGMVSGGVMMATKEANPVVSQTATQALVLFASLTWALIIGQGIVESRANKKLTK
jgi:hypothetical protein